MTDDVLASTRSSYDSIVADYERQTSAPPEPVLAFRALFAEHMSHEVPLADLGCGPGRDLAYFLTCNLSGVGVDASAAMVQRAHELRLSAVVGDIRRPPLRNCAWGGIWASASLLHVPNRDVPSTLAAWHDLLEPGGTLALTTTVGAGEAGWEDVPYAPGTQGHSVPLRRWFAHHDRGVLERSITGTGFTIVDSNVRESHRTWLQLLATKAA